MPSEHEMQVPLLHLINSEGGSVSPSTAYIKLAAYYALTEEECNELQPSGTSKKFNSRVAWARYFLCSKGFLDRSVHGLWKITALGKSHLGQLGLLDRQFSVSENFEKMKPLTQSIASPRISENDELIDLVLDEIAPNGPQHFPDDFLNNAENIDFCTVEMPGTEICMAPLSQTTLTSKKGYFKYKARNPTEAKYIIYSYTMGTKSIKIPVDNFTTFKVIKSYEQYCRSLCMRAFEYFIDFTHDEEKAEQLTQEVQRRLDLRAQFVNAGVNVG